MENHFSFSRKGCMSCKKLIAFVLVFLLGNLLFSCSKERVTIKDLLKRSQWKTDEVYLILPDIGFVSAIDSCSRDNEIKFGENTVVFYFGQDKCSANEPESVETEYYFNEKTDSLIMGGYTYHLLGVTSTTLFLELPNQLLPGLNDTVSVYFRYLAKQ